MVGIWRQRDPAMLQDLKRRVHADALVTTLNSALAAALELSKGRSSVPVREDQRPKPAPEDATKVEAAAPVAA
jgi:hypothetical protein